MYNTSIVLTYINNHPSLLLFHLPLNSTSNQTNWTLFMSVTWSPLVGGSKFGTTQDQKSYSLFHRFNPRTSDNSFKKGTEDLKSSVKYDAQDCGYPTACDQCRFLKSLTKSYWPDREIQSTPATYTSGHPVLTQRHIVFQKIYSADVKNGTHRHIQMREAL